MHYDGMWNAVSLDGNATDRWGNVIGWTNYYVTLVADCEESETIEKYGTAAQIEQAKNKYLDLWEQLDTDFHKLLDDECFDGDRLVENYNPDEAEYYLSEKELRVWNFFNGYRFEISGLGTLDLF